MTAVTVCPHGELYDSAFACPPCGGTGQPKRIRRTTTATTVARFDGTCPACDGPIVADEDDLVREDDAWIHAGCAS